jgi:hypothetical protein
MHKSQSIIRKAVNHNALKRVGHTWVKRTDTDTPKTRKRAVYRWDDEVKERLMDYKEQQSKLPCGHRAHIYNKADGEFGCKYCDDEREWSKEVVKEALE